jgi:hypothetical protein
MSNIDRPTSDVSAARSAGVGGADPAENVSSPLSASRTAGSLETRVAGMMGALLTPLEEVTGSGRPAGEPPLPPVPSELENRAPGATDAAGFSALQSAPATLRHVAAAEAATPAQRTALEEAADVVEAFAALRRDVVFRSSR